MIVYPYYLILYIICNFQNRVWFVEMYLYMHATSTQVKPPSSAGRGRLLPEGHHDFAGSYFFFKEKTRDHLVAGQSQDSKD